MAINDIDKKLPSNAIWKHFKGDGKTAHFYHAAGFPLGLYDSILSKLGQKFKLSALGLRATWPDIGLPPERRDYWKIYADDLIAFIEQECRSPIIGIGHSMGATCTILAAEKRPDLFKTLVLIEPAMVSRSLARLIRLTPKVFMKFFEPAKSTLNKIDTWVSRDAFLDHCRQLRTYKRFSDEAFDALARHGVFETPDGRFHLSFPKSWEAHVYTQPPNVMTNLERLNIPCVAIRGKPSVFFTEALWQEWQNRCPNTVFKQNPVYGHLLPLEGPTACFELINEGLAEIS
jgi:pimeloyl-ACP methyl ester carboxylesterase